MNNILDELENVKNDMNSGKYNFCKNGKCVGCGNCCSNILPMTEKEIKIIREYVAKNNIKPVKHLAPVFKKIDFDLHCPFMENSGNKRCRIYSVRPYVCKMFTCDPTQREIPSKSIASKSIPVIVLEEFFGDNL